MKKFASLVKITFKKASRNVDKIFKTIAQVYCLVFGLIYTFIVITAAVNLSKVHPSWTHAMIADLINLIIILIIAFGFQVLICSLIYWGLKKAVGHK